MKLKMAQNSLFAVLLRSPWWISLLIAAVLAVVAAALMPEPYKVVGAMSCVPFLAIALVAAVRQWKLPSGARVEAVQQALGALAWPAFSTVLEQAFQRDGHAVKRHGGDAFDFELEQPGRRTLVSARRWKSARTGVEPLRALQAARTQRDVKDAMFVTLAPLSEPAAAYAREHGIAVWQAAELAQALRGQDLASLGKR